MPYRPSDKQLAVIDSRARVLVVIGGAGTGKTTTAAAAAAKHLATEDLRRQVLLSSRARGEPIAFPRPPARVLFLSFSRTAVAQVLDRAGPILGRALGRIDVATFDGLAWKMLNSFGDHAGFPGPLRIISSAESRVDSAAEGMTYKELVPAAMRLLTVPRLANYYDVRYSLVICDEFQDTSEREWEFLQAIAPRARLVLLGDVNQCIYAGMKNIDPAARIAAALALPGAELAEMPPASHRDPSGVLPAAADAARVRNFSAESISFAIASERLGLVRYTTGGGFDEVLGLVRDARNERKSISIFTHTNEATTALSDALAAVGIRHEQVGLSESYGEALRAQGALIEFALIGAHNVRRSLAVFVASNFRPRQMPELVDQILNRTNDALERAFQRLADDLREAWTDARDPVRLAAVVTAAYSQVGTLRGQEVWLQAARRLPAALRALERSASVEDVVVDLARQRDVALVGSPVARPHMVQVMNLHQTKGREADRTILLLQPDEFHGYESEPYPEGSRLLYVVMTRARQDCELVVPEFPHGLWLPLVKAFE